MISIYESTEKTFKNNGIKILKPQKAIITKVDNGEYYLEIKDKIDFLDYYQTGNIIRVNTPWGYQGFRILNVEIDKKTIIVKANHLYFDTKNYIIKDSYIVEKNCNYALNYLNDNCDATTPFILHSDITNLATYRCVRTSLEEGISTIIDRWGGHLVRNNFDIEVKSSISEDRGVTITFSKNLIKINKKEIWDDVITKILPVGKDGVLLPETYLEVSEQLYDIPYTKVISFEQDISEDDYKVDGVLDEDSYKNALIEDLRTQAQTYLQNNKFPKVNYTVEANIKNISDIGDLIYVKHPKCNVDLTTNVISLQYDCIQEKFIKIEFGNFKNSLKDLLVNVKKIVSDEVKKINPDSILDSAVNKATDLIKNAMGGYVYKTNSELYIMDTDDPATAVKVWRWNINGLGYSSTGIDGPFGIAMTMDGSIVADFITSGKISTSLIEGYDSLTTTVKSQTVKINKTVKSISKQYKIKDSTDDWSDTYPTREEGQVILAREKYIHTDDSITYGTEYEITGDKGDQGIQGPVGADGTSQYFFVRYSENSTGNPMTTAPTTNTKYMGVANTTSPTAPTSYTAYTWSLIKGNDGIPGTAGADGKTPYLHIKYSTDGENFTPATEEYAIGECPGAWIGQCVDFNETDSTTFSDYTWYKFTEDIDRKINDLENGLSDVEKNYKIYTDNEIGKVNEKFADYATTTIVTEVSKKAETAITDSAASLEFSKEIKENGVSKLKTSKGFTFDDNGLGIDSTDSKTSFNADTDGIEVINKSDNSTLLFVGYDSTLKRSVVRTDNIEVDNYILIADVYRAEIVEDDTYGKGLAFFYVGGD